MLGQGDQQRTPGLRQDDQRARVETLERRLQGGGVGLPGGEHLAQFGAKKGQTLGQTSARRREATECDRLERRTALRDQPISGVAASGIEPEDLQSG